jgi:hypothetical protein
LTAFDRPQRLAFSPSYELPFGTGRRFLNSSNGVVKRLVGGWQVLANTVYTPARWGNLRDRWATTYDASVIKNTRIREGMNCQFRFEAFNALNTPVFSSDPNLTPTSTNFGKISRDNGQNHAARSLQFGFRFMF